MKLALAYSTKDQVELTRKTLKALTGADCGSTARPPFDLYWCDGSVTKEGKEFPRDVLPCFAPGHKVRFSPNIVGGADAAIAWKLSTLLSAPENYEYIGLAENDVLLQDGWFEETMALFEKGAAEGLTVGAVSPRSYVDRVLIQRNGYGVMFNVGAGFIIFTREAAEIVLRSFKTGWWPSVRLLFAQLSGIDVATFSCFGGVEQMTTTDWSFEAQLASHGLATLALTPARCTMIGQVPSLAEQGLELTKYGKPAGFDKALGEIAFKKYADNLHAIREGIYKTSGPGIIHSQNGGMLFFPHQLGYLAGRPTWQGKLELQWTQGWGPFAYRAGPGGASLAVQLSGSCAFLVSGGANGAKVSIRDTRSGFNFAPDLPPEQGNFVEINVPGGPVPRIIEMKLSEGGVFYGIQTADPQMLDTSFRFDWSQLPEAK